MKSKLLGSMVLAAFILFSIGAALTAAEDEQVIKITRRNMNTRLT